MLPVALLLSLTLGSRIGTAPPVHPASQGLQNPNVALKKPSMAIPQEKEAYQRKGPQLEEEIRWIINLTPLPLNR